MNALSRRVGAWVCAASLAITLTTFTSKCARGAAPAAGAGLVASHTLCEPASILVVPDTLSHVQDRQNRFELILHEHA